MYPTLQWPVQGRISQFWGENRTMYARYGLRGHNGLDIAVPEGTPVKASADGWVREAMHNDALGNYVKIMHGWGHTVYAHLSKLHVRHGQRVKAGDVIGLSGNTGNSTGPHLHLGVRINPYDRGDGWLGYSNPLPLLQHPTRGAGLAPHWIPSHRDNHDFDIMRRWQPASLKIFENGWRSPELMDRLYRELPDTLFVWRDWPLSEQHEDMRQHPEETGRRHAKEWLKHFQTIRASAPHLDIARTIFTGINEPHVWSDLAQVISYYVAFMEALEAEGARAGVLNLSVGWPGNNGPDTPPDWAPYEPLFRPLQRGGHYLIVHEYWDLPGPAENWGWWAGRIGACPWQVPIIIGEAGIDRHVRPNQSGGWQTGLNAEQYWAQLLQYEQWMMEDSRIHSIQVFTYDVGSRIWNTFDVRPALRERLAAHGEELREVSRPWIRGIHTAPNLPYAPLPHPPQPEPPQPEPPSPPQPGPPSDELAALKQRVTSLEKWARSLAYDG